MTVRTIGAALLLTLALVAGRSIAALIIVDPAGGGYSETIQPALTKADSGDTVLVVAGTYTGADNKNLDFAGKSILLLAQSGAASTIIDGEGSGRAFWFHSGEANDAVVDGFTIINAPDGSPIRITMASSPTIRHCIIKDHYVTTNGGGGVFIQNSSPILVDCTIADNFSSQHGGGIYVTGGSPVFTNCMIVGNFTDGRGGGAWLENTPSASITRCTVAGNRANQSLSTYNGGGLLVSGTSSVAIARTIIWANEADQVDDLYVTSGSAVTIDCCDLDISGTGGGGQIDFGPENIDENPHFCSPACCSSYPWEEGDYSLAANSPCLAATSPCGLLIGAAANGCGVVTVWIGDAGDTDWFDPKNWSTGHVPGPVDQVQLAQGNVILDGEAHIGLLNHCPEDFTSGSFTLHKNGQLFLGCSAGASSLWRSCQSSIGGSSDSDSGTIQIGGRGASLIVTDLGSLDLAAGIVAGTGALIVQGVLSASGNDTSRISADLQIEPATRDRQPDEPARSRSPRGLFVQNATLELSGPATSNGQLVITGAGQLVLKTTLENLDRGLVTLQGGIYGPGAVENLGLIQKNTPGISSVQVPVDNLQGPGYGQAGTILVSAGTLRMTEDWTNRGQITVGSTAELQTHGTIHNEPDGDILAAGDLTGTGSIINTSHFDKADPGVTLVTIPFTNNREGDPEQVGEVQVNSGILSITAPLINGGEVNIAPGATLDHDAEFENLAEGVVSLAGDLTGTGTLANYGLLSKASPSSSSVSSIVDNRFDAATAEQGLIQITGGSLSAEHLHNSGPISIGAGSTLAVTDVLNNWFQGQILGEGTLEISGATFVNVGLISPGLTIGALGFSGSYTAEPSATLRIEIGGRIPGLQCDQLNIDGTATFGGALDIRLVNGFVPVPGDTFVIATVSGGDAIDSRARASAGFTCYSGIQLPDGPYLEPVVLPDSLLLVATDTGTGNKPPLATPDVAFTDGISPLTIRPLSNDTDPDDDGLDLVNLVTSATRGIAFIDSGRTTITYLPPNQAVDSDTLYYTITDCNGAKASAFVQVVPGPAAIEGEMTPPVECRIYPGGPNPFNPKARIRIDLPAAAEIRIVIYDLQGRRIKLLTAGRHAAGTFEEDWWGRDDNGRDVPSGIYFARLEAGQNMAVCKLVLVR